MILNLILSFILGLQPLHELGYRGEGITIAVIDGGFYRANQSDIFPQDHIIGMYDLVTDSLRETDMLESAEETHGTMCLSTMLYESDDFTGTAPDAHYILIRTENSRHEYTGEVDNLIHGMLLADSLGADIITISLGYYYFDDPQYNITWDDLDGKSRASQTATLLARHNRLVCVAAGNEGNKAWQHIDWPADADSILTVGATDSLGNAAPFSSYGPTADGRIKPEVASWGAGTVVYSPTKQALTHGNGTSFATPQIAGMAASLWSAMPQLTAMQLRERIIRSANQYPNYDFQRGYGTPDAWRAYSEGTALINETSTTPSHQIRMTSRGIVISTPKGTYDLLGRKIEE